MVIPLDPDKIEGSLPEAYRPIWHSMLNSHLNAEPVYFASYCTKIERDHYGNGSAGDFFTMVPLLFYAQITVITSGRYLKGYFSWLNSGREVRISSDMGGAGETCVYRRVGSKIWDRGSYLEFRWMDPNRFKWETPKVHSKMVVTIDETRLEQLTPVTGRRQYQGSIHNETIDLLELSFDDDWLVLPLTDGNKLYELFRVASENRGQISGHTVAIESANKRVENSDITSKLERLGRLYQDGLISQSEFDALKANLFSEQR